MKCKYCEKFESREYWTYLNAGFNGIEIGDKDDIDKFECIHCGYVQGGV